MTKQSHIILIVVLFTLMGCKKEQLDDCFSTTGSDKTEERLLPSFSKLNIGDNFKVILKQDTGPERIRITAGENLLEGISTEVENGELIVKDANTCNFVRSYKRQKVLEIFIKDITHIFVFSACSISNIDTLHLENLRIDHSALEDMVLTFDIKNELFVESINSGGMTFSGKCKIFKSSIEEITNIDARNLVCEEVLMDTHTLLDSYVNATRLLFVKIYGSGNVYYVSEPSDLKELNVKIGSGDLIKLP